MENIYSFMPIADEHCTILILGSIPGRESLRKGEYYGHRQNGFWRLMCALLGEAYSEDYGQRTSMLLRHHIALWDVLQCCERQGSLDANIKNPVVNDFPGFFREHPNIMQVFFNGRTAYQLFKKSVGFLEGMRFVCLGSTSPAHAVSFEKRLEDWRQVIDAQNG